MSNPPAAPNPKVPAALPAPPAFVAPADRTVEADLLVDVPQLRVDELSLELEASALLNRVKLEAKGLEAGLYLKADFENLRALQEKRTADTSHHSVRTGLRELLAGRDARTSSLEADEHVVASSGGAREHHEHESEHSADGDGQDTLQRARHAAVQGAKAAGLTAAGLAGGALLESRGKPSRKLPRSLPIPRRRTRAQVIRDEIVKRLPSPA